MKLAYSVVSPESGGRVKACYGPYEDIFPKLKEMGYEGIELLVQDPERVDTALLDQALEKWELSLAAIGTSPMQSEEKLFLIHPDKACSGEAKERCHSLLKLCARYQVPALIGKYRGQVMDEEGCREKDLEAALAQVCREAKALGVEVLLEPQNATNINNINTISDGLCWIQKLGYENLGLLADIYHMGVTENSISQSLKAAGKRIGFIHMSDSGRKAPGEGNLPIAEVMRTLREINYEGYISLEIDQEPDSLGAAARSAEYLKGLISKKDEHLRKAN